MARLLSDAMELLATTAENDNQDLLPRTDASNKKLLEAVKVGDLAAVKTLFTSTDSDWSQLFKSTDEHNFSVVHIAVDNNYVDIVSYLVDRIREKSLEAELELKCSFMLASGERVDWTALHIACYRGRYECIKLLQRANPKIPDQRQNTPLHIAARSAEPLVLDWFLRTFARIDTETLNSRQCLGFTPLIYSAAVHNAVGVERLLRRGAKVDDSFPDNAKYCAGQNVLHIIVKRTREQPQHTQAYLDVFQVIKCHLATDHITMSKLLTGTDGKCKFESRFEEHCMNVLQLAISIGAVPFLKVIVESLPTVYKLDSGQNTENCNCSYNVMQHFVPLKRHNKECQVQKKVKEINHEQQRSQSTVFTNNSSPRNDNLCLRLASIYCTFDEKADMERIKPIAKLMTTFSKWRQWAFLVIMIVHITHMSFFTHNHLSIAGPDVNNDSSILAPYAKNEEFIAFLIWPSVLLGYELSCFGMLLKTLFWKRKHRSEWRRPWNQSKFWMIGVLDAISTVGFIMSTILWFSMTCKEATLAAMVLIWGWMHSLRYVRLPAKMHAFVVIIQIIFIKDVFYILVIYVFVLVGFASSAHVLLPVAHPEHRSFDDTQSTTFDDTVYHIYTTIFGNGALFERDAVTFRIIIAFYLCFSVIVLLNILIAMMNKRYDSVIYVKSRLWFVETLDSLAWFCEFLPYRIAVALCHYLTSELVKKVKAYDGNEEHTTDTSVSDQYNLIKAELNDMKVKLDLITSAIDQNNSIIKAELNDEKTKLEQIGPTLGKSGLE